MKHTHRMWGVLLCLIFAAAHLFGAKPALSEDAPIVYTLWIGETQVTPKNAADVFGDGTVRFTPSDGETPAVLELNGYRYRGAGFSYETRSADGTDVSTFCALFYEAAEPLVIRLTGENVLELTNPDGLGQTAGIFGRNRGANALTLIGTDEEATLSVSSDKAEAYSAAIQCNGDIAIENLRLRAVSAGADVESDGVISFGSLRITDSKLDVQSGAVTGEAPYLSTALYATDVIVITGSEIVAKSGESANASRCVYGYNGLTVTESKLEAAAGPAHEALTVWSGAAMTITDSELLATSVAGLENAMISYVIGADKGLAIAGSTVEVSASAADWSYGVLAFGGDIAVTESRMHVAAGPARVIAEGFAANAAQSAITIADGSEVTVTLRDSAVSEEETPFHCGLDAAGAVVFGDTGEQTKVCIDAGAAHTSIGVLAGVETVIGAGISTVSVTGRDQAFVGPVKNAVPGTGTSADAGESAAVPARKMGTEFPQFTTIVFENAE